MKFAILALFGLVSGQQIENDLTENMRESWSADTMANAWRQVEAMGHTLEDMDRQVTPAQRNHRREVRQAMERRASELARSRGPAYMRELQAWGASDSVRAENAHNAVVQASPEF